jgi:hypothetical protein
MCSPTPPACSGFPVEARIGPRDLLDWDRCVTALAGMAPLWEPGTAFAYR